MTTGYEHMTDAEFWAEVGDLLTLIQRHAKPGAALADGVGALADYVHAEAERRDPELAASARRQSELVKAADARQQPPDWDADLPFTEEEQAEWQQLIIGYRQRLAALAARVGLRVTEISEEQNR